MKEKLLILFLLGGLVLGWGCGTKPPTHVLKAKQLAGNAYDYHYQLVDWINRDGWASNNGTTKLWRSVSYNLYAADPWEVFVDKINSSKVANQIYWSQYTSYHPGGREEDDPGAYPWAGTRCQGLVYRSAIKAGYSIDSYYLNCIDCWANLGTEIAPGAQKEGDLILMDLDTSNNHPERTYEHLGVMWGLMPDILSAIAIYYRPSFEFKAGIHTEQQYNEALVEEFPDLHLHVYYRKYIRLPE
jgi:hypothetical protein